MDKNRKTVSTLHKIIKATLISVLSGELVTIACLFVCSLLMAKAGLPLGLTDILAVFSICAGGFAAGYINGRLMREKGLIYGAACGGILALIIILVSLIFSGSIGGSLAVIKLLLVLILASAGGFFGANKKSKRIKY